MIQVKRWFVRVVYIIAALVYALDQILKWLVRTHMTLGESIPVFPPALYIDFIRNPGGAFGILPNAHVLFGAVALVVVGGVIYADRKLKPNLWSKFGLALVLGGALGNLTDRVLNGTVVDYVYFKPINFPVFNLADVAIDVGIVLLILRSFAKDRHHTVKRSEEVEE